MKSEFASAIPYSLEPWINPPKGRVFNAAIARYGGYATLISRLNSTFYTPGKPDITDTLGVYIDTPHSARKVGEISLRDQLQQLQVVSIEDLRLGPVSRNGMALGGGAVVESRNNRFDPYPFIAEVDLRDPHRVRIENMRVIHSVDPNRNDTPAKNTLVLSRVDEKEIELVARKDRAKFNDTLTFTELDRSSGEVLNMRDEQVGEEAWCAHRLGLTGLPIELVPANKFEKRRQIWVLHGINKNPQGKDVEYEYHLGLGVRIETMDGEFRWKLVPEPLLPYDEAYDVLAAQGASFAKADSSKNVVYATGVDRLNGHIQIPVTYADSKVARLVVLTKDLKDAANRMAPSRSKLAA